MIIKVYCRESNVYKLFYYFSIKEFSYSFLLTNHELYPILITFFFETKQIKIIDTFVFGSYRYLRFRKKLNLYLLSDFNRFIRKFNAF